MDYYDRRPSFKEKLRFSSCFSCCFRGASGDPLSPGTGGDRPASLLRSSSAWVRSRAQELPKLGERCRTFVSRFKRRPRRDFGYDPLDYALNFDEGEEEEEDAPLAGYRHFSSRLPATPPQPPVVRAAAT